MRTFMILLLSVCAMAGASCRGCESSPAQPSAVDGGPGHADAQAERTWTRCIKSTALLDRCDQCLPCSAEATAGDCGGEGCYPCVQGLTPDRCQLRLSCYELLAIDRGNGRARTTKVPCPRDDPARVRARQQGDGTTPPLDLEAP